VVPPRRATTANFFRNGISGLDLDGPRKSPDFWTARIAQVNPTEAEAGEGRGVLTSPPPAMTSHAAAASRPWSPRPRSRACERQRERAGRESVSCTATPPEGENPICSPNKTKPPTVLTGARPRRQRARAAALPRPRPAACRSLPLLHARYLLLEPLGGTEREREDGSRCGGRALRPAPLYTRAVRPPSLALCFPFYTRISPRHQLFRETVLGGPSREYRDT
jgi:hypothetical protein